ncbi:MAG: hypothetical protein KJ063_02170 [Anaerolineae bacterium]|nr:hypothetical protein [Anaerolineae bacterium]
MDEIGTLAFDMGINHEELAGNTPLAKSRELVRHCDSRGLVDVLVQHCVEARPDAPWPV